MTKDMYQNLLTTCIAGGDVFALAYPQSDHRTVRAVCMVWGVALGMRLAEHPGGGALYEAIISADLSMSGAESVATTEKLDKLVEAVLTWED